MNKSTQPTILTRLDLFIDREKKKIQEKDARNATLRDRIALLQKEIRDLQSELAKKTKRCEKDQKEYLKILEKHETRIHGELKKQEELKEALRKDQVSIAEFQAKSRTELEIRESFRAELQEQLAQLRPVLRSKRLDLMRIELEIMKKNFGIREALSNNFELFFAWATRQHKELERFRGMSLTPFANQLKDREIDLVIAESGAYPQARIFQVDSKEALELLCLNPIINEEHLPELEAKIEEIKESEFDFNSRLIKIVYYSSPIGHHISQPGFNFSIIPRPGGRSE